MTVRRQFSVMAAVVCAVYCSGCSQTTALLNFKKVPTASAKDPVFEILGLWEPAEGRGPDGKPRRGCAGQVLFMTRGQKSPVKVGGEIVIHQFDDVGTADEQTKPLHTFRFDTASWNNHFAEGSLGPSYSVFIPYMRDSAYKTICALRIQYTSPDGQVVHSSIARINLPGADKEAVISRSGPVVTSVTTEPIPSPKRKLLSQRLATLDGSGLKPVREQSGRRSVQHAAWQTESNDDDDAADAAVEDLKTRKIAELEAKLADMRKEATPVTSSRSSRFRTAADNRKRFRRPAKHMSLKPIDGADNAVGRGP